MRFSQSHDEAADRWSYIEPPTGELAVINITAVALQKAQSVNYKAASFTVYVYAPEPARLQIRRTNADSLIKVKKPPGQNVSGQTYLDGKKHSENIFYFLNVRGAYLSSGSEI